MQNSRLGCFGISLLGLTCWVIAPAWAYDPAKDTMSDGLAFKVGLAPLRAGDQDELRIWFMPRNMNGAAGFAGYVVNAKGIKRCRSLTNELGGSKDGGCDAASNPARARRILDFLPQLSRGGFSQCTVLDGETVQVEGVAGGAHFDYQLYSPYNCHAVFKDISDLTMGDNWRAP